MEPSSADEEFKKLFTFQNFKRMYYDNKWLKATQSELNSQMQEVRGQSNGLQLKVSGALTMTDQHEGMLRKVAVE